jgi:molybdate transport system substrate-binding protein
MKPWTAAWTAMALFLAAAQTEPVCSQEAGAGSTTAIQVFAAASTTNAIGEIARRFTKASGIQVHTSFGSSGTLAQQIVHGADADVFVSADVQWAAYLAKEGVVVQEQNLLGNRLVIVVPGDSKWGVKEPQDLLAAEIEHLALANPESVPAGKYAKQALVKLALWEQLKPKVTAAEDVRSALTYVETGAAEAGIVYATDAAISQKVRVTADIPASLTGPVRYPIVLLRHGKDVPAAESFYKFLRSPEAIKVFRNYGFTILTEAKTTTKPGG